MGFQTLAQAVADLERHGHLKRVATPVDPHLEMAEIQRRLYQQQGPALLFTNPVGCQFPMVANLYGTLARTRFLFRDSLDIVRKLVQLKADPGRATKEIWRFLGVPRAVWHLRPKLIRGGDSLRQELKIEELPQLKCWPRDGGPFITLPLVYSEHPDQPGWRHSNLGMYRVQLAGNEYKPDEVGLHYQIHRGLGVRHAAARRRGELLPVNIAVGGPPSLTVSAVMPLPEGLPELAFAGVLGNQRIRLSLAANGLAAPADADFVISGHIHPTATRPEGPFGDHLGYYSLTHPFPYLTVQRVTCRPGAIWPFTVVGRPPQEDTSFGELIHDLTGPVIPTVLPGVKEVNAVDAAGVHPLLLAVGSERYVPYAQTRRPQELLTIANAILGQGQLSLAKYLFLVAQEDNPDLRASDIPGLFRHLLERVDWRTDLHFQTRTTIDTLDYSAGEGLNAGSKLVIAVAGEKRRELARQLPPDFRLPDRFTAATLPLPGIVAVSGPKHQGWPDGCEYAPDLLALADELPRLNPELDSILLVVLVDDAEFCARSLNNWLWVTFTRSNPATDVYGCKPTLQRKHFGCAGPLIIDARLKPHMAWPLEEDPTVSRRVDEMTARGGCLHGILK